MDHLNRQLGGRRRRPKNVAPAGAGTAAAAAAAAASSPSTPSLRAVSTSALTSQLLQLRISTQAKFFDRRVERTCWHPARRDVLAVASHGGDVALYHARDEGETKQVVAGRGAGGAISALFFDPRAAEMLVTADHTGSVTSHDLELAVSISQKEASARIPPPLLRRELLTSPPAMLLTPHY